MKLRELLEDVKGEIKSEKINDAKKQMKEMVLQIEELKKTLKLAEDNLNKFLETDIEELDIDVW